MSSVLILQAPVIVPDFGSAVLICEWRKGEGYRTGIMYQTNSGDAWWHSHKTYAKLHTALNAAARIAKRCRG